MITTREVDQNKEGIYQLIRGIDSCSNVDWYVIVYVYMKLYKYSFIIHCNVWIL